MTHIGRAGEYTAISELSLRGWNVAVPVVDVGDDAFVIEDRDKATRRIHVKTSVTKPDSSGGVCCAFKLSRSQLRAVQPIELFFVFMLRVEPGWKFLAIARERLLEIRRAYEESTTHRPKGGRRPRVDDRAKTDFVSLDVTLKGGDAKGWNAPLTKYLGRWPDELWVVDGGPGSVGESAVPEAAATPAGDPDLSQDPER